MWRWQGSPMLAFTSRCWAAGCCCIQQCRCIQAALIRLAMKDRQAVSALLLQAAKYEQMRCNNKVRFILAVVAGKLIISNRKRADINSELETQGYDKMPSRVKKVRKGGKQCAA